MGVLTRSAEDTAMLFQVMAGYDPKDATTVKMPVPRIQLDGAEDIRGMRIGVPAEYFIQGIQPEVESAVREAILQLQSLGASVVEVSLPHTRYALAAYYVVAMSEASSNLARFDGLRYGLRQGEDRDWHTTFSAIRARGFGPEVKRRILLGTYALSAGYYGRYYLKALKVRTLIKQDFLKAFQQVDILASPTMPIPAFRIGERINAAVEQINHEREEHHGR